jgi:integrase
VKVQLILLQEQGLLFISLTGIRINELLALKVVHLETLLEEGWISIDRLKKGSANHKAFLTREWKQIVKARKKDFEFLFLMLILNER